MIVHLDYHDAVYISKDTPIVYIHDKDVLSEYLEVNEVMESTQDINWLPQGNVKLLTLI